jgi:hypothetical protein
MFPAEFYAKNTTTLTQAQGEVYNTKIATAVSLKFAGNSQLLAGFYDAIESKLIK